MSARHTLFFAAALALAAGPALAENGSNGPRDGSGKGTNGGGGSSGGDPTFYPGGRTNNPMPRNGGAWGGTTGGLTDAWGGNH
jgi:hypothetical protein